jgi:hypothetical protein
VLTGDLGLQVTAFLFFRSLGCSNDQIYHTEVLNNSNEIMHVRLKEQFNTIKEVEKEDQSR